MLFFSYIERVCVFVRSVMTWYEDSFSYILGSIFQQSLNIFYNMESPIWHRYSFSISKILMFLILVKMTLAFFSSRSGIFTGVWFLSLAFASDFHLCFSPRLFSVLQLKLLVICRTVGSDRVFREGCFFRALVNNFFNPVSKFWRLIQTYIALSRLMYA